MPLDPGVRRWSAGGWPAPILPGMRYSFSFLTVSNVFPSLFVHRSKNEDNLMLRSLFGIAPSHALATVTREPRRKARRTRFDRLPGAEFLEARALLTTGTAHIINLEF